MNTSFRQALSALLITITFAVVFSPQGVLAADKCKGILNEDALDRSLQFLEELKGESAIDWVEEQNAITASRLETDPRFDQIKESIQADLNSPERLIVPSISEDEVIDFWRDEKNVRGIWRTASLESYEKGKPNWKTVIDFDALAKKEKEDWVFSGTTRLRGSDRMIVALSRSGQDAVVLREFDRKTGKFVKNGFVVEEAVGNNITWINEDEVFITSKLEGGGETNSEYPISVRRWKRGQKLKDAVEVARAEETDISIHGMVTRDSETQEVTGEYIYQGYSFNDGHMFAIGENNELTKIDKPINSSLHFVGNDAFIYLEEEFSEGGVTYPLGTILRTDKKSLLEGTHTYEVVFQPNEAQAVSDWFIAKDRILMVVANDVSQSLIELKKEKKTVGYTQRTVVEPGLAEISLVNTSRDENRAQYIVSSFLEPAKYYSYNINRRTSKLLGSGPETIDSSKYQARQFFATSPDGTRVPYYMIAKRGIKYDGTNPAIVYAYGGFKISMGPYYMDSQIKNWVDKGGVYVIANARGGGEYGPNWWRAALQENRYKSYEDVAAVGDELVRIGLSDNKRLAVHGGSNGGLMSANLLVRRPDLWGAAIVDVPLIDMLRFHLLSRGASWQDEYGFPDNPAHREHLRDISPIYNIDPNADLPEALYMTSTADDRVHAGHARKMAMKSTILGHSALFFENRVGGHGGATNSEQRAHAAAMRYVYLMQKLMDPHAKEEQSAKKIPMRRVKKTTM